MLRRRRLFEAARKDVASVYDGQNVPLSELGSIGSRT